MKNQFIESNYISIIYVENAKKVILNNKVFIFITSFMKQYR